MVVRITVRPAQPGDAMGIARVHVETWRDTYPLLLPHAYLVDELDVGACAMHWQRVLDRGGSGRVFVAGGRRGEIVGYTNGGPSRQDSLPYEGEVYALYVTPGHQGLGIGGELFRSVAAAMRSDGLRSLIVEVLEQNPARFFYEALGGQRVAVQPHVLAGQPLPAVIYGWSDVALLVSPTRPQR
jgi:ribosomal protein S18 acetylase RimI-like enzyme